MERILADNSHPANRMFETELLPEQIFLIISLKNKNPRLSGDFFKSLMKSKLHLKGLRK